jgi:hypothetical protein
MAGLWFLGHGTVLSSVSVVAVPVAPHADKPRPFTFGPHAACLPPLHLLLLTASLDFVCGGRRATQLICPCRVKLSARVSQKYFGNNLASHSNFYSSTFFPERTLLSETKWNAMCKSTIGPDFQLHSQKIEKIKNSF